MRHQPCSANRTSTFATLVEKSISNLLKAQKLRAFSDTLIFKMASRRTAQPYKKFLALLDIPTGPQSNMLAISTASSAVTGVVTQTFYRSHCALDFQYSTLGRFTVLQAYHPRFAANLQSIALRTKYHTYRLTAGIDGRNPTEYGNVRRKLYHHLYRYRDESHSGFSYLPCSLVSALAICQTRISDATLSEVLPNATAMLHLANNVYAMT